MASFTCHWCRGSFDTGPAAGSPTTCPSCGAAIDVRTGTTDSGWQELPAIPDMARLQFGRSRVQIEGTYVPVADFHLVESMPHSSPWMAAESAAALTTVT